jgi:hypothetical protein
VANRAYVYYIEGKKDRAYWVCVGFEKGLNNC